MTDSNGNEIAGSGEGELASREGGTRLDAPLDERIALLEKFSTLEQDRLDIHRKRAEVLERMMNNSDAEHERQIKFETEKFRDRSRLTWVGLVTVIVVALFVLFMAFFGDGEQSRIAGNITDGFLRIMGGGSMIALAVMALWRMR